MDTMAIQVNRFVAIVALVSLLILSAGCGRMEAARASESNPDIKVALTVDPAGPVENQASTLLITLVDQNAQPLLGARILAEGDMTHAGMTPVLARGNEIGGGHYTVPITWTMAGDWEITVRASLADGRSVIRMFPVTVAPATQ